jgi:hypothetical protein
MWWAVRPTLVHPKVSASSLSPLHRADLDWGLVAMQSGRGAPGLVGWYDGAALHTSMLMAKLRSPTTDSLRW